MPLYEFRCSACDRVFEELRRAGDESAAACPDCGRPASRIVSLSAFALKGSGFYATDYGNRRPGSFQRDGKGTIKGTQVPVPQLARDPSVPLEPQEKGPVASALQPTSDQPGEDAKEGA
jgi:putative FmdB family regulatory protein